MSNDIYAALRLHTPPNLVVNVFASTLLPSKMARLTDLEGSNEKNEKIGPSPLISTMRQLITSYVKVAKPSSNL